MAKRTSKRGNARTPSLYRRAWQQTDDPLVAEARAQTLALQKLQLWLRLAYSALALAVLLAVWGIGEGGGTVAAVCGVLLSLVALGCVLVLRTGIDHGRKNVNAMLATLERRREETPSQSS